jgi:hypothetical protein
MEEEDDGKNSQEIHAEATTTTIFHKTTIEHLKSGEEKCKSNKRLKP